MSTAIHNCPNCSSVIIADTDECPECGHILDQSRAEKAVLLDDMSPARMRQLQKEVCPHCGEGVPVGLLRCWQCNGFMRQEIEDRFNELATNPQPIIYSSIPPEQRTELLPARASRVRRSDDDGGFTLADGIVSRRSETPPADKRAGATDDAAALADALMNPEAPDAPKVKTPDSGTTRIIADAVTEDDPAAEEASEDRTRPAKSQSQEETDLFQIAIDEQRDAQQRRRDRRADRARKTMLLPCSCGAWIRVQDSLAGMVVRCRQCRAPVQVPVIRRRVTERRKTDATPQLQIKWIDDVWFHVLTPTSVVLKPGSAEKNHTEADIALTESGISIVSLDAGGKKKSLLAFGGGGSSSKDDARRNLRNQIAEKGSLTDLSDCEVRTIDVASIPDLRLVQPVARVQESMFAGVPIFGEGRIAVFLPLEQQGDQQLYCSFSLSGWRQFAYGLNKLFNATLPATENGVPAEDKTKSSNCFIKQSRVEFVSDLNFYQNDSNYELELTGFRCTACQAVISEEGRASKKLGGSAGKGIAKAKCPKCSAKMGEEKLFRISKAPEAPGADDDDE